MRSNATHKPPPPIRSRTSRGEWLVWRPTPSQVIPNPRRKQGRTTALHRTFVVGLARIELATSALSVLRSNRLSYSPYKVKPIFSGLPSRLRPTFGPMGSL
jgi:hypothetical protein